jgi:hypothetical protein
MIDCGFAMQVSPSDNSLISLVNSPQLAAKSYSQTSKSLSFPKAFIGNPDETLTGPPDKNIRG